MGRSTRTRQQQREATEAKYLAVAAEVAAAGGYPSLDAIAARLGASPAGVRRIRGRIAAAGRWPYPMLPQGRPAAPKAPKPPREPKTPKAKAKATTTRPPTKPAKDRLTLIKRSWRCIQAEKNGRFRKSLEAWQREAAKRLHPVE